jgi:hypothetical protein
LLLGVELRDGVWQERVSVVANDDWPEEGLYYLSALSRQVLVKFDASGALHALVPYCADHSASACIPALSYLVKRGSAWSRPLMFRTGAFQHPLQYAQLMAVDDTRVYVAWTEKDAGLLGRWILLREAAARYVPAGVMALRRSQDRGTRQSNQGDESTVKTRFKELRAPVEFD